MLYVSLLTNCFDIFAGASISKTVRVDSNEVSSDDTTCIRVDVHGCIPVNMHQIFLMEKMKMGILQDFFSHFCQNLSILHINFPYTLPYLV